MSIDLSEKKKRSLATLYRAMPTAELARRVADGGLAAPAQEAAQAELPSAGARRPRGRNDASSGADCTP